MSVGETLERHDVLDRNTSVKLVLLALDDMGLATRDELAEELGLSYATVWNAVDKLREDGLVEIRPDVIGGLGKKRAADGVLLHDSNSDRPVWERARP